MSIDYIVSAESSLKYGKRFFAMEFLRAAPDW
jgi:hypothetical protein